jgi:ribosome-associated heat shock protein Hsp15
MSETTVPDRVRLDKWLWAARFFKTRSLAVDAIDHGHVQVNGERVKPAKEVRLGMQVTVRSYLERTVVVRGLSDVRRGAPEAARLYEETPESVARREQEAERRRLAPQRERGEGRPTKRDRRQIRSFTESGD